MVEERDPTKGKLGNSSDHKTSPKLVKRTRWCIRIIYAKELSKWNRFQVFHLKNYFDGNFTNASATFLEIPITHLCDHFVTDHANRRKINPGLGLMVYGNHRSMNNGKSQNFCCFNAIAPQKTEHLEAIVGQELTSGAIEERRDRMRPAIIQSSMAETESEPTTTTPADSTLEAF